MRIVLTVNGKRTETDVDPERPLLWVLRNELDLTGAKYGCGEGQCGACTVLLDGVAHRSCITAVSTVGQKKITTIEGLADGERLHPVQESFIACDAMQCGYCTPGMILASVALLRKNADPSKSEIKQALEGNVCRCGTHHQIVAAVQQAAQKTSVQLKEQRNG